MGNITLEESSKTYEAVVTNMGSELMMQAVANGKKVAIAEFAVGDGNGEYYRPDTGMTALKNEVWRGNIDSCRVSSEARNILIISAICPGTAGGFTIREMAVFDTDNNMIAVCNCPATPKVLITDGVVNEMRLEMEIALINGQSVELVIDPNIVTATKAEIEEIWKYLRGAGKVTIGLRNIQINEGDICIIANSLPVKE